jgi:hypothetical protein
LGRQAFVASCALLVIALGWVSSARAAPTSIVVTSANDSGPGTLRDAILEANGNPSPQGSAITFAMNLTITPATALPALTRTTSIDGSGHTVVIDGAAQGSGDDLTVDAPGSAIRGLTIVDAPGNGVTLGPGSDGSVVGGVSSGTAIDFIGTTSGGAVKPNGGWGVAVTGGSGSVIGDLSNAQFANVIQNNRQGGVLIRSPASGDAVVNSIIGGSGLGNGGPGVEISGSSANQVGGVPVTAAASLISFNTGDGVTVTGSGAAANQITANIIEGNGGAGVNLGGAGDGNSLTKNMIFNNAGLGITLLGTTTPKPNAPSNPGPAPNQSQNYPVITGVDTSTNTISGTLHSIPATAFGIDLFLTGASCDPSGFGQGSSYLGSTTVSTNSAGDGSFSFVSATPLTGQTVTATATDSSGNSSEFSQCFPQFAGPHITLSAVQLPFAGQLVGTLSPVTFVNARNTGTSSTVLTTSALSGPFIRDAGNSGASPSCSNALSLAPGQSCDFGLRFAPTTAGPATGRLDATFTGTKPLTVLLSGTGTTPAPPPPVTKPKPIVGKPTIGHQSLAGLAGGHPQLKFTIHQGAHAAKLKSLVVKLDGGLKFVRKFNKKERGFKVSGGEVQTAKIHAGRLVITLKSAVSSLTVTLGPPALQESDRLRKQANRHKVKLLNVSVGVTDVNHLTTQLTLAFRRPR